MRGSIQINIVRDTSNIFGEGNMETNFQGWPGDFYHLHETLSEGDQTKLQQLREFLEARVAPVITEHWIKATFPHELLPEFGKLGIVGPSFSGDGFPGYSRLTDGFIQLELSRVDPSIATFFGVQGGLAAGSIYLL